MLQSTRAGCSSEMHQATSSSSSSSSSQSTSTSRTGQQEPPVLDVLVKNSPNLMELEVIAVKFDSFFQKNHFISPKTSQFNPW